MGIKRALHRRPSSSQRNANREEYDIRPFDGTNVNAGSHRSDPPKGRQDKLGKKAKCSSRAVEHEDQGGLAFAGRSIESSNPQTSQPQRAEEASKAAEQKGRRHLRPSAQHEHLELSQPS